MTTIRYKSLSVIVLAISLSVLSASTFAANRKGSHRVGGTNSHGKGSHYEGGEHSSGRANHYAGGKSKRHSTPSQNAHAK
ncbi:MAG: hypothetical protein ACXU8A_05005 [Burkholderiaceae bacterium]